MPYKDPEKLKEYKKRRWIENKESIMRSRSLRKDAANKRRREHRLENIEAYRKIEKQRYLNEREVLLKRKKEQYARHKKSQRAYERKREKENIEVLLASRLRSRLRRAISQGYRNTSVIELTGCSILDLKKYSESKFLDGMNWNNYGEWHIDHILPCASFNLKDPKQQKACFHYTNLQPLWARDNISKGKRIK